MTTFNTGNPIGSAAAKDLYDNAENLDEFVNSDSKLSHPDRLGVERKTWHGMEQDFQAFLANSGYNGTGVDGAIEDYVAGIEITAYNQVIRDGGELWRLSAGTPIPYTTTGAGMPEGGSFVSVGDAALRQELAAENGALLARGSVIYVDTIADLQALPTSELVDGQQAITSDPATSWLWDSISGWQPNPVDSRMLNVLSWGSFTADIKSAIQALSDSDVADTLVFPKGVYEVSADEDPVDQLFTVPANKKFVFMPGASVHDVTTVGLDSFFPFFRPGAGSSIFGLDLVGSGKGSGILTSENGVTVSKCTTKNFSDYGIRLIGDHGAVENCYAENITGKDGIRVDGQGGRVIDCETANCNRWGFASAHVTTQTSIPVRYENCKTDGSVDLEDLYSVEVDGLIAGGSINANKANIVKLKNVKAELFYSHQALDGDVPKELLIIDGCEFNRAGSYSVTAYNFYKVEISNSNITTLSGASAGIAVIDFDMTVPGTCLAYLRNVNIDGAGLMGRSVIVRSATQCSIYNSKLTGYTNEPASIAADLFNVITDESNNVVVSDRSNGVRRIEFNADIDISLEYQTYDFGSYFFGDESSYMTTNFALSPQALASSNNFWVAVRNAMHGALLTSTPANSSIGYGSNRTFIRLQSPHTSSQTATLRISVEGRKR